MKYPFQPIASAVGPYGQQLRIEACMPAKYSSEKTPGMTAVYGPIFRIVMEEIDPKGNVKEIAEMWVDEKALLSLGVKI
jgi:hypothetical protein